MSSSASPLVSNPYLTLGVAGIAGAAGAIPTPASSTTTPNLTPENEALLQQLGAQYSHLAQTGVNLQPYQQQQENNINNNSNLVQQASREALAARGLSNSPVSGVVAANQNQNRVSQITNLQQSLPLLQNQLQTQNLGDAASFTSSIPHGTTTKTQIGGGIGGFLGGFGSILAGALKGPGGSSGTPSDKRLKENITDVTDGLDKVLKMKPKEFNYKSDLDPSGEVHSGFMAHELEKLFPSTVNTDPTSGMKMVKYHEIIPKVVKAIQELHAQVQEVGKNSKNIAQKVTAV